MKTALHGTAQALRTAPEVARWWKARRHVRGVPAIAGLAALCAVFGFGPPDTAEAAVRVGLKQVGPSRGGGDHCGSKRPESRTIAKVSARRDRTSLRLRIRDARPDTLYTIWLFVDAGGPVSGGPPVSGGLSGQPVGGPAGASELGELLESAAHASGSPVAASAFRTDGHGDARVTFQLSLPPIEAVYPLDDEERDLEELAGQDLSDHGPVAIGVGPQRIFRIEPHGEEA